MTEWSGMECLLGPGTMSFNSALYRIRSGFMQIILEECQHSACSILYGYVQIQDKTFSVQQAWSSTLLSLGFHKIIKKLCFSQNCSRQIVHSKYLPNKYNISENFRGEEQNFPGWGPGMKPEPPKGDIFLQVTVN